MRSESAPIAAEQPELALAAMLPALVAATSTGTGIALGAAMAVVLLITTVVAATFTNLAAAARLALCALVAGALAICVDLLCHAFAPDLRTALGPFLFAVAPAALLHVAGPTGHAGGRGGMRAALLAVLAFSLVGVARELLGRGTLFADVGLLVDRDAAAWQLTLPWRGLLVLTELPGALFAVALLVLAFGRRAGKPHT